MAATYYGRGQLGYRHGSEWLSNMGRAQENGFGGTETSIQFPPVFCRFVRIISANESLLYLENHSLIVFISQGSYENEIRSYTSVEKPQFCA